MSIQIFGVKKCADTRKAERFFKERRVPYQFINLAEKGLSKGELASIQTAVGGIAALVNTDSKEYQKRNLKYLVHNIEDELLNHPLLLKTPIVRQGRLATIGYHPEVWQAWNISAK